MNNRCVLIKIIKTKNPFLKEGQLLWKHSETSFTTIDGKSIASSHDFKYTEIVDILNDEWF